MASRSVLDLAPQMRSKALAFLNKCAERGLDVLIYCTVRSSVEQQILYERGRSTPGKIVTNLKAGESAHNYGLAFDGVPLINGKPAWEESLDGELWQTYGTCAELVGLEWGGRWRTLKEGPHCQLPDWKEVSLCLKPY